MDLKPKKAVALSTMTCDVCGHSWRNHGYRKDDGEPLCGTCSKQYARGMTAFLSSKKVTEPKHDYMHEFILNNLKWVASHAKA